jgi:prokaryotic ubiquitin-like protein Pup
MSEQIRQSNKNTTETSPEVEEVDAASSGHAEVLARDLDDLLDQIDEVLESDAEEFVKNYVQKGGE